MQDTFLLDEANAVNNSMTSLHRFTLSTWMPSFVSKLLTSWDGVCVSNNTPGGVGKANSGYQI